jgi:hypothetical protein
MEVNNKALAASTVIYQAPTTPLRLTADCGVENIVLRALPLQGLLPSLSWKQQCLSDEGLNERLARKGLVEPKKL